MFSCTAFNLQDWLLLSQYCQAFQPCNAEPANLSQVCSLRNKYKVVRFKAFKNESYTRLYHFYQCFIVLLETYNLKTRLIAVNEMLLAFQLCNAEPANLHKVVRFETSTKLFALKLLKMNLILEIMRKWTNHKLVKHFTVLDLVQ